MTDVMSRFSKVKQIFHDATNQWFLGTNLRDTDDSENEQRQFLFEALQLTNSEEDTKMKAAIVDGFNLLRSLTIQRQFRFQHLRTQESQDTQDYFSYHLMRMDQYIHSLAAAGITHGQPNQYLFLQYTLALLQICKQGQLSKITAYKDLSESGLKDDPPRVIQFMNELVEKDYMFQIPTSTIASRTQRRRPGVVETQQQLIPSMYLPFKDTSLPSPIQFESYLNKREKLGDNMQLKQLLSVYYFIMMLVSMGLFPDPEYMKLVFGDENYEPLTKETLDTLQYCGIPSQIKQYQKLVRSLIAERILRATEKTIPNVWNQEVENYGDWFKNVSQRIYPLEGGREAQDPHAVYTVMRMYSTHIHALNEHRNEATRKQFESLQYPWGFYYKKEVKLTTAARKAKEAKEEAKKLDRILKQYKRSEQVDANKIQQEAQTGCELTESLVSVLETMQQFISEASDEAKALQVEAVAAVKRAEEQNQIQLKAYEEAEKKAKEDMSSESMRKALEERDEAKEAVKSSKEALEREQKKLQKTKEILTSIEGTNEILEENIEKVKKVLIEANARRKAADIYVTKSNTLRKAEEAVEKFRNKPENKKDDGTLHTFDQIIRKYSKAKPVKEYKKAEGAYEAARREVNQAKNKFEEAFESSLTIEWMKSVKDQITKTSEVALGAQATLDGGQVEFVYRKISLFEVLKESIKEGNFTEAKCKHACNLWRLSVIQNYIGPATYVLDKVGPCYVKKPETMNVDRAHYTLEKPFYRGIVADGFDFLSGHHVYKLGRLFPLKIHPSIYLSPTSPKERGIPSFGVQVESARLQNVNNIFFGNSLYQGIYSSFIIRHNARLTNKEKIKIIRYIKAIEALNQYVKSLNQRFVPYDIGVNLIGEIIIMMRKMYYNEQGQAYQAITEDQYNDLLQGTQPSGVRTLSSLYTAISPRDPYSKQHYLLINYMLMPHYKFYNEEKSVPGSFDVNIVGDDKCYSPSIVFKQEYAVAPSFFSLHRDVLMAIPRSIVQLIPNPTLKQLVNFNVWFNNTIHRVMKNRFTTGSDAGKPIFPFEQTGGDRSGEVIAKKTQGGKELNIFKLPSVKDFYNQGFEATKKIMEDEIVRRCIREINVDDIVWDRDITLKTSIVQKLKGENKEPLKVSEKTAVERLISEMIPNIRSIKEKADISMKKKEWIQELVPTLITGGSIR